MPFVIWPPSVGSPETEMVNLSEVPGSPLSCAFTVNVHGAPFLVQVPENDALLPEIVTLVIETL